MSWTAYSLALNNNNKKKYKKYVTYIYALDIIYYISKYRQWIKKIIINKKQIKQKTRTTQLSNGGRNERLLIWYLLYFKLKPSQAVQKKKPAKKEENIA